MKKLLCLALLFAHLAFAGNGYIGITNYGAMNWASSVLTASALPVSGNNAGDARIALDTFDIYVWNGSSWITQGAGGTVTAVTASSPLASSGGTTPNISLTGIVGISNGGTNSSTALANGQLMMSNSGSIIEDSDVYSNGGSGLSVGAPLSNSLLGEVSFGVYTNSTTTSAGGVGEIANGFYYGLSPGSTQTGTYTGAYDEVKLQSSVAMEGYYYGRVMNVEGASGTIEGPMIGAWDYMRNISTSTAIPIMVGRQITVSNGGGSGAVQNNGWALDVDTIQVVGTSSAAKRGTFIMLGDHTYLNTSYDGCTVNGSSTSNECDAIYVRAGSLNASGTDAGNWVLNSQETHPSEFGGPLYFGLQYSSSQSIFSNVGAVYTSDLHEKSTGTTPTVTVQTAAGTSASCSIADATDLDGQVTITTGTLPSIGAYCAVNFNLAYNVAPICQLTPASASSSLSAYYATSSTSALTINLNVALGATIAYVYNYHCAETQ